MMDLVISGPDMSGTSSQVRGLISFFRSQNKIVRDLRGTELDALFHAQTFWEYNQNHFSLSEFMTDSLVPSSKKKDFSFAALNLIHGEILKVASLVNNKVSSFIDPHTADVWILEEPTRRGSGQVVRTTELYRTHYGSAVDHFSAAHTHQVYRIDEFLRFRKALRETRKIIIRSRSEESACYQIYDAVHNHSGIRKEDYLALPGHRMAFANPPTHLFIVCLDSSYTIKDYQILREERRKGRELDDLERNAEYQLLVNQRYATDWLEKFYLEACAPYGAVVPMVTRFNMLLPAEQIEQQMIGRIKEIFQLL